MSRPARGDGDRDRDIGADSGTRTDEEIREEAAHRRPPNISSPSHRPFSMKTSEIARPAISPFLIRFSRSGRSRYFTLGLSAIPR